MPRTQALFARRQIKVLHELVGFRAFEKPFAAADARRHAREREVLYDGITIRDKEEVKTTAIAIQNDTPTDIPLKPAFAALLILHG